MNALIETNDSANSSVSPRSLDDFIQRLTRRSGVKRLDFLLAELERFAPTREELAPWCIFDEHCYARNSVFKNEDFEALVLTWRSGQRSPIHNHRGSSCAGYVVEGVASEVSFERSPHGALFPAKTEHVSPGRACGSFDQEIHQIANLQGAGTELISLHVYSPPLKGMELFSLSQSTFADYDDILIRSAKRAAA